MAVIWLFPLLWAIYTALRPYARHAGRTGYISIAAAPATSTTTSTPGTAGDFAQHFLNTLIVVIPAVIVILLVASMVAFAVSRFSWRFNLLILMIFTAGNLLPPQVIIVPLYRMYLALPLPAPLSDNGKLCTTSTSASS